jgi:hypothetical protein
VVLSPGELLSRLQAEKPQVQAFAAKGRLTVLSPTRNYSGASFIKGIMPATVRADILDPLGRTHLNFFSNGQEVLALLPKENKLYRGEATPENLAAFIPTAMTLPQMLRLMVGDLPLSPGQPSGWAYESDSGRYRLEWTHPTGVIKEKVWVDGRDLKPVKEEWFGPDGKLRFAAEYGDFGRLPQGVPGQITFKTPHPEAELRLTYREMAVNPGLQESDLAVSRPPGVEEAPLK